MQRLQAEEDQVMDIEREAQEARMKEKKVNGAVIYAKYMFHMTHQCFTIYSKRTAPKKDSALHPEALKKHDFLTGRH